MRSCRKNTSTKYGFDRAEWRIPHPRCASSFSTEFASPCTIECASFCPAEYWGHHMELEMVSTPPPEPIPEPYPDEEEVEDEWTPDKFPVFAPQALLDIGTQGILDTDGHFVIRNEYVRTYEKIMNVNQDSDGVLVTGQPGIGKSHFLIYTLIRRLAERKPTVLKWRSKAYIFRPDGPSPIDSENADTAFGTVPSRTWALLDTSQGLPETFFLNGPLFRILTSSPDPDIYLPWLRGGDIPVLYMNPWTWSEIAVGVRFNEHARLANFDASTHASYDHLHRLFFKYGPVPSVVYRTLLFPSEIEDRLKAALRNFQIEETFQLMKDPVPVSLSKHCQFELILIRRSDISSLDPSLLMTDVIPGAKLSDIANIVFMSDHICRRTVFKSRDRSWALKYQNVFSGAWDWRTPRSSSSSSRFW
ncbi:hypothetical protein BS47DRAFT_676509 [Hydnum rufescens UP504]|uniref:Crinkler (CRN) family protein n=1 Tax=Hydnum rufescens UP504 TaxID=1448309 RepID=A0A9P6B2S3_9AGAM|nr:hypothetical protein BS47DRAFT_676509 [Hydnum rufescens UP504]